jgi:hypothetical protein
LSIWQIVTCSRATPLRDELTIAQHIAHIHSIAGVEFGDDIAVHGLLVPQVLGDDGVECLARAVSGGVVEVM